MAEHRVASGDVELAVVEAGDPARPAVLLLHGYPDTKEVWAGVVARLEPRYHVIAYDTRGAGRSSAPAPGGGARAAGYALERLVDDALAVLDAVCPGKAVHLVGHDWGSIAGWELAISPLSSGRLASFTSVSGPCLDHFGHWVRDGLRRPTPARLAALAGQARRSWYVVALGLPGAAPLAWRTVGRHWPRWMARAEGVPEGDGHPAPTVALDGERGAGLYRANVRRHLRAPRPDPVARVPVQLVVATRDRYISPAVFDGVERWAPGLRRRQLDTSHWVPRTHPEVLAGWIAEFVDDVDLTTSKY